MREKNSNGCGGAMPAGTQLDAELRPKCSDNAQSLVFDVLNPDSVITPSEKVIKILADLRERAEAIGGQEELVDALDEIEDCVAGMLEDARRVLKPEP